MNRRTIYAAAAAAALIAGGAWFLASRTQAPPRAAMQVSVVVPALTAEERAGQDLFDANCAACHGPNGTGSDRGPPFLHRIYEPSHHGDMAFMLAARQGVRAHHWPFGDMPPVAGVTDADVVKIIAYVRGLQRANGIN